MPLVIAEAALMVLNAKMSDRKKSSWRSVYL